MSEIKYPYFFLGFEEFIKNINQDMIGDLSLFKRFSFEEAIILPKLDVMKSIQIIAGTPSPIDPNNPGSACSYNPIKLSEFMESNCLVIPEANLNDKRNLKVYINGVIAEENEDYKIIPKENKIQILWAQIKKDDIFSYSIPLRLRLPKPT